MDADQRTPEKSTLIAAPTIKRPHRRPNTLRRYRLLDLIHQNIHRKLTFVCAPAGYGKTTLVTDFCDDTNSKVVWCQIGRGDNDLRYFFRHLVLAFHETYSKFGDDLTGSMNQEMSAFPHALAIEFINEITTYVDDFTVLVLDDYHTISQELAIVSFIEEILELVPDNLRMIIGSRSVYGIPTSSLYVSEELALITMADLRFRAGEIKDLARQYFHIRLSDEQTKEILSNSDGWITSILLFLRDGAPSIIISRLTEAREYVYDYLTKEIYTRLPEETKRFLLRTALCDDFDIPLANHIVEIDNAEDVIKQLEDQNLFISSVQDSSGKKYQYHQLFQDFLANQFCELPETEQSRVHMMIAQWYEREENAIQSVVHFLQAGNREKAAKVMDRYARFMYIEGQESILEDWFQTLSIPPNLIDHAPELVLNWVKAKVNQGKLSGCLELLDQIEPIFLQQNKNDHLANLMIVRGMILRFQNQHEAAIEIAKRTREMVARLGLDKYYTYQARRLEGLERFHIGEEKEALLAFNDALCGFQELFARQPSDRLKHDLIMLLTDIGMMSLLMGNIFNAQGSFKEALTLSLTLRGNQGDLATCANNQAFISFLKGDLRQAWQYYEQALRAAEQAEATRTAVHVLSGQAEILMLIDEPDKAEATLHRAEQVAQSVPGGHISPATHNELAELEKNRGNFNQAMFHLREAAYSSRLGLDDPDYLVRLGGIHLEMDELEVAKTTLLPAVRKLTENSKPSQMRSLGYYTLAEVFFNLQDVENALIYLKEALSEAAILGYDAFLVNAVHHNPTMLLEMGKIWKNQHLQSIMDRATQIPQGCDQLIPHEEEKKSGPFTLRVKALGESEIRCNAEIIPQANWKSAGARALFFYILDRGRAKRDEIAVEFWPEFSNAKVNSNFHTTLWRVRNALGKKSIIAFDGQYYSIQADGMTFDVREFEEVIIRLGNNDLADIERRTLSQRAIELYEGDFLVDIDMPWSDQRRIMLREKYLLLLEQFAGHEFKHKRYENARKLYEQAIKNDPYQDALHMGLMKCLIQLNVPAAAKAHFNHYTQELRNEVGVEPGVELRKLVGEE